MTSSGSPGAPAEAGGLHEYYRQQGVLPTFAAFADEQALGEYARKRALLMDMLHLPVRVFAGADMIEFGPDSGENALVFARWGARMTLVEPNPNAWSKITGYFEHFGVQSYLHAIERVSLQDYVPRQEASFDFVVAEGFIYTVRPEQLWIDLFRRLLKPGGIALLSYQERSGSLFEFLLKVVQAQHRRLTGLPSVESARRLFAAKWESIPHTRTFESWTMDVLENPYVRGAYVFDADEFYCRMAASGIPVYASWPGYTDPLRVHWHKQEIPREQQIAYDRRHIARSRLSFVCGAKAYLCTASESELNETVEHVQAAMESLDALIDRFERAVLDRAVGALAGLRRALSGPVLIDPVPGRPLPADALRSAEEVLRLCGDGDAAALATFCSSDPGFIGAWGQPAHLVAVRRDG